MNLHSSKLAGLFFAFFSILCLLGCSKSVSSPNKNVAAGLSKTFIHVDDNSAQSKIYKSQKPVFMYFYAKWCLPCKILNPRLNKIASHYKDQLQFVRIDVEEAPQLAEKFNIEALPRMQIHSQKCVEKEFIEGVKSEKDLKSFIDETLPACR